MKIGIILYEDNNNLRESLCNLIAYSGDLKLLGSFPGVGDVSRQVKELKPDVILMDIDMPGMNGIEAVRQIRTFNREVQIMMLTVFDDNQHVLDAICAGASGYLLKKYISDHLLESIKQVLQGGAPMSPGIARMVIESMHKNTNPDTDEYHLTRR